MTDAPTPTNPPTSPDATPVAVSQNVINAYGSLIDAIPDATDEDAQESILLEIAAATTPGDLDAPWTTDAIATLVEQPLRILSVSKRPSDYLTGIGWYVVVKGAQIKTGETFTFTTGALNIVGQLAVAAARGWLPLDVIPHIVKPAKDGKSAVLALEVIA